MRETAFRRLRVNVSWCRAGFLLLLCITCGSSVSVRAQITQEELDQWFVDNSCVDSGQGDYVVETFIGKNELPMLRLATSSSDSAAALACFTSLTKVPQVNFQYQATLATDATAHFLVFPAAPGCDASVILPSTSGWEEYELEVSCDSINVVNFVLLHGSKSGGNEYVTNLSSMEEMWSVFSGTVIVANEDGPTGSPRSVTLLSAYPNPFNTSTTTRYIVQEAGPVRLTVFDALGREVETLVDSVVATGSHEVVFGAEGLPPGVYTYRLQAGGEVRTGRVVLTR